MTDKRKKLIRRLLDFDLTPFWATVSRNWMMKVFCLLMAFAVWQGVRENTSFEVVVTDIPVTILPGDGKAVLDQSTDTVSIRFRGSRDDVRFINNDQISVTVDISGRSDRLRQTVNFTPRYVKAPSRAHAVQFDPAEVTVTIDREVERTLPVKAVYEGDLPSGIQFEKAVCTPASVKVRGAEQLVRDLEQVRTVPISLDGRYNSFKAHVAVAAGGQLWSASPDRVTVDVNLFEQTATRQIEEINVRPLLASDDTRVVRIRPETVTVVLSGSPQQIEQLKEREVYPYVDCTEMTKPADYEVPVRVDLPPGLNVDSIEPATVRVNVKRM
ncbi:MAG: YbbR-like domain-containing protein [Kiritimatiellales bacterium]